MYLNNTNMITIENIMLEYPGIDQNILPDALKKSEFEFIKDNIDLYHDDETIKKYMDTFVEKLNEVLHKPVPEKTIREKKPKSPKSQDSPISPSDPGEPDVTETTEPVEKVSPEVAFIKRYVGLHGKTKDRSQVLSFLSSLQKAILEKRIRKTSAYAKEIRNIQQQLIRCVGKMGNTIRIDIDDKTLGAYAAIAHSEKTMLSVVYIKQYIGLHGKPEVKEKAKALSGKIEMAVELGKISTNDPYFDEISEIRASLKSYLGGKAKAPAIKESTLNGIMAWMANRQKKKKVAKYLQKIYETEKGLRGVDMVTSENQLAIKPDEIISSVDLAKLTFKTIGFTGKWLTLIGDPSERFTAMLYGGPGCGKSTLAMEFAYYLANDHAKKVLYIANEEKVSKTLQDKLKMIGGNHPNLNFVGVMRQDKFNEYDCIFIDSVNTLNVTPVDLEEIAASHPGLSIIYICQTTKEGKYRGSREFEHFADVVVRVENGVARPEKNRFGGRGELVIW
jgi:DNA replication protein DnaC